MTGNADTGQCTGNAMDQETESISERPVTPLGTCRLAVEVNMAFHHGIQKATELFCNMVFINIVNLLCLLFLKIPFLPII